MRAEILADIIGADFYTGVPDSLLRPFCDYLTDTFGTDPQHHIIAANEGNAAAIAAGYYLAAGRVPAVYMQNSGEGNMINPLASLLNENVYAIPCIFLIGWRGEPGTSDEPQHVWQGQVTCSLLDIMNVSYFIVGKETAEDELRMVMHGFRKKLSQGADVALVIRKGALEYDAADAAVKYHDGCVMNREEIIRHITAVSGGDPVICTTGKAGRELYEIRESRGTCHAPDFLTVGSMGHCSSIALGAALHRPDRKIWCIDGDGAALMHMGALPVIAHHRPENLVHIIINNGAHESVGGQPTVMRNLNFWEIARDCGYPYSVCASDYDSLDKELKEAGKRKDLTLIEAKCAPGSKKSLGRPAPTALKNRQNFMEYLNCQIGGYDHK